MFKSGIVSINLVVVLFTGTLLLPPTEGLECYSCSSVVTEVEYEQDRILESGEESCWDRVEDDLKATCPTRLDEDRNILTPLCVKLFMNYKNETGTPPAMYLIAKRGCFYTDANITMKTLIQRRSYPCGYVSKEEMKNVTMEPLQDVVDELFDEFPANEDPWFCSCDLDNCNTEYDSASLKSPGKMWGLGMLLFLLWSYGFLLGGN